jgi:hypothetical protein
MRFKNVSTDAIARPAGAYAWSSQPAEKEDRIHLALFIGPGFGARFMRGRLGIGLEADLQLMFLDKATALVMPVKICAVF